MDGTQNQNTKLQNHLAQRFGWFTNNETMLFPQNNSFYSFLTEFIKPFFATLYSNRMLLNPFSLLHRHSKQCFIECSSSFKYFKTVAHGCTSRVSIIIGAMSITRHRLSTPPLQMSWMFSRWNDSMFWLIKSKHLIGVSTLPMNTCCTQQWQAEQMELLVSF